MFVREREGERKHKREIGRMREKDRELYFLVNIRKKEIVLESEKREREIEMEI